eukprot:TRINITY_DN3069_c0_g1_i1.p1 TRINITY_DN3069_c0_g1~~TRINITY_DN3069_c0_g1_i1.p1  ORF type:complete len:139 (-),score=11.17 TRINITY_DN3069_c0_g1_i1:25-441(-)
MNDLPNYIQTLSKESAIQSFKTFSLVFGLRASLSVLLRSIALLKHGGLGSLFSFKNLFDENNLVVRVEAVRLGIAIGLFSGGYNFVNKLLLKIRKEDDALNSVVAGFLSGFSFMIIDVCLFDTIRWASVVMSNCYRNY